jgi:ribosomal protein L32
MSVRMRHTREHSRNRRSHHALSEPAVSIDAKDGAHLRHRVSPITGKYKGEQVLNILPKDKNKVKAEKSETEEKTKKSEKTSKKDSKAEEVKKDK